MEPELILTEDERRVKEKRMTEIKKMIALQSLQQLAEDNHGSNQITTTFNNGMSSSFHHHHEQIDYQKEKKARERVKLEIIYNNGR